MTQYHLHLRGYVGGSDFSTEEVVAVLNAHPDTEVNVLIDSTGGQLASALSISSAFRRHGQVHVHFAGMNASAATIASLGAQRITMDASALYLVHKCSVSVFEWADMDADRLQKHIDELTRQQASLEKLDAHVSAMYAAKCRKSQDELLALMKTGGWLTAAEAKEWGFIDEVTDFDEDVQPELTEAIVHAMAAADIPIPAIPYARPRQEDGVLARLLSAITSLFHGTAVQGQMPASVTGKGSKTQTAQSTHTSQQPPTQLLNRNFRHIEAALKVEGFTASEGGDVRLTASQMQMLNARLQSDADRIAALQEEVAALKGTPAAHSPAVVNAQTNDGPKGKAGGHVNAYLAHLDSARALYNLLS